MISERVLKIDKINYKNEDGPRVNDVEVTIKLFKMRHGLTFTADLSVYADETHKTGIVWRDQFELLAKHHQLRDNELFQTLTYLFRHYNMNDVDRCTFRQKLAVEEFDPDGSHQPSEVDAYLKSINLYTDDGHDYGDIRHNRIPRCDIKLIRKLLETGKL